MKQNCQTNKKHGETKKQKNIKQKTHTHKTKQDNNNK